MEAQQIIRVPMLGAPRHRSPLSRPDSPYGEGRFVSDQHGVARNIEVDLEQEAPRLQFFEKAGARARLFFDPAHTRAAIVTCGGLCPGLNDVIRSVYLELRMNYGVREVLGIRHGYQGLNPQVGKPPLPLTLEHVDDIHEEGGTILGTSRGPQDLGVMIDFLQQQRIDILFCVGGDGTQRGAHQLCEEIQRRGLPIAIVGIPKTIDNDLDFCDRSFGFVSAVEQAMLVIRGAHTEARAAVNGIGLVRVMGRNAGFIAAAATIASQDVNFTLVPEVPFALDGPNGFLAALRRRMLDRQHAVVLVAEGAGQDLLGKQAQDCDASGNVKLQDIGLYLKERILAYFREFGPKIDLKYIDPSYVIRSVAANCDDSILCDFFARNAVHAAMAGKTDLLIGFIHGQFIHVPIAMAVAEKRRMDVYGDLWTSVLAATGQATSYY